MGTRAGTRSNPGCFQADVRSQDVSFRSGDVTLRGTVLLPNTAGPNPAMALLAGSGARPRDKYRLEAEAFAQTGIVTLIYDKRTSGYSTTGSGNRSYAALADDALAAVSLLQHHPDVDPSAVGLWGHSEGGWVAPLAASRSTNVAFVVTVGASAVPAAQQTVWALGNRLRSMGVSGSMVDTFLPATVRLLVSAGAFAEADYDGVDAWQRVQQPVLAIWGAKTTSCHLRRVHAPWPRRWRAEAINSTPSASSRVSTRHIPRPMDSSAVTPWRRATPRP
jgi:hypothetical protein